MKALTIWQPWASLIVKGYKRFEFRRYPAPRSLIGQRIVIHAGKHKVGHEEWVALTTDYGRLAGSTGLEDMAQMLAARDFLAEAWAQGLPMGAALGTAILWHAAHRARSFPRCRSRRNRSRHMGLARVRYRGMGRAGA